MRVLIFTSVLSVLSIFFFFILSLLLFIFWMLMNSSRFYILSSSSKTCCLSRYSRWTGHSAFSWSTEPHTQHFFFLLYLFLFLNERSYTRMFWPEFLLLWMIFFYCFFAEWEFCFYLFWGIFTSFSQGLLVR